MKATMWQGSLGVCYTRTSEPQVGTGTGPQVGRTGPQVGTGYRTAVVAGIVVGGEVQVWSVEVARSSSIVAWDVNAVVGSSHRQ